MNKYCTRCEEPKKLVFVKIYSNMHGKSFIIALCKSCTEIFINVILDYTIGDEYGNLLHSYGKQIKERTTNHAQSIQKNGRSNEKTIRRKERSRDSKQNLKQKNEGNRKNSRKGTPLSGTKSNKLK